MSLNNNVQDKTYIPLTPFKGWVLENFPFIESDFDCITNYQLLCKITEYLNNIISNQNQVEDLGSELVTAYNQLLDYVNNYFDNLDVQEEINNKLDDMAEDGSLTTLISNYVDPIYQAYETEINTSISTFQNTVNTRLQNQDLLIANLESGEPIFVSSTSDMVDTTKVYVLTTNFHIYYYDGTNFVDSTITYGITTNALTGYSYVLSNAERWATFSNDMNNLIGNNIYMCNQPTNISSTISNMPFSTFNGTVMAYNYINSTSTGLVQIAVNPTNGIYIRQKWSDWKPWIHVASQDLIPSSMMTGGANLSDATAWGNFSNDFNNLIANKIYVLSQNSTVGADLSHSPTVENPVGTVIAYNITANNNAGIVQIFTNYLGTKFCYRIRWGGSGWTNWVDLADKPYVNELQNKNLNELYKAFDTVGIIGDSLASGESAYKSSGNISYVDIYEKSWGQFMARDSGNTYYNFSKGGLTTRSWFTNSVGYDTASDGNHTCKAYIIALGVNDTKLQDYLGSSSDIDLEDYTNNDDTFYGNYAKIIQTMKILQPKAKFFLFTIPTVGETIALYNTAIRNISEMFDNVYLIDLMEDYFDLFNSGSFIYNNRRSGHYNAITYEYMAKIFEEAISKYMYDNYSDFEQVEFIGTQYEWTE